MSDLYKTRIPSTLRKYLIPMLAVAAVVGLLSGGVVEGQEQATEVEEQVVAAADTELWTAIVERYEVVVLSRALLLEPLGDEVELRTIEISDDGVAIDGDELEYESVAERVGSEDADLIYQLVAMDQESRMRLFEDTPSTAVAVVPEGLEEEESSGEDEAERHTTDTQVIVGNSHVVEEDEVTRDAVVFGGPLTVLGKVIGDATALGGPIIVEGEVTGEVVAVGGSVTLKESAEVLGDVVAVGGRVERADGARVEGEVVEVPFVPKFRFGGPGVVFGGGDADHSDFNEFTAVHIATSFMWAGFRLVVVALLAALAMLLAKQPLQRIAARAASEPWKSGVVGLVSQILVLPLLIMVVLILCISIIGIPLLLLVPFACLALVLIAFLGYCAVCWNIGRFLEDRFGWQIASPYVELFIGIAVVQLWTIIGHLLDVGWGPLWFFGAMLCIVGAMIQYAVWTIGLGGAVLTRFGSADGWKSDGEPPAIAAEPVEPVEPEAPTMESFLESPTESSAGLDLRPEEPDEPRRPDSES